MTGRQGYKTSYYNWIPYVQENEGSMSRSKRNMKIIFLKTYIKPLVVKKKNFWYKKYTGWN